ncbi:DUF2169 family type VI secretion system accessory protein [Sorangium sp. So ce406]|uniref:DUF2169 family type VI secretion system accessory protein n=1 Tax=Sorangium sp. So ce406 TaxID=3133311 RepID=UPI003F5BB278
MRIVNQTRAKHATIPMRDEGGREHLVCVLKYTFAVGPGGRSELVSDGPGPYLCDEYNGEDPAASSVRKPSDVFLFKPGTDVILIGHAHPPPGRGATHVDVTLRVGPIDKTVRAHGLRVWQRGLLGRLMPGPARPIHEPVPLVYELAWGGLDLSDPARPLGEPRNTVGRGVARDPDRLVAQPATQLERRSGPHDEPASFGAIHRHWMPRSAYAGTYDIRWQETKMPLLPDDFDPRFNVSVAHDQWSSAPLRGDEPVEVTGATPEGSWRFSLPRIAPGFATFVGDRRRDHPTHLDTMLIDADLGRVELTFRAAAPLPRKYEMLESVMMFEKQLVARRNS